MIWNGKDIKSVGDLLNEVTRIAAADDQDAADRFMAEFRAESPYADSNVGYLSGYLDVETMAKVQRMFGAPHPIFGSADTDKENS